MQPACPAPEAGANGPASSRARSAASALQAPPQERSRPDPSGGRARLFLLLPFLALLSVALGPFAAAPAQAQTTQTEVWSATLTVGGSAGEAMGFFIAGLLSLPDAEGSLSDDEFSLDGTDYEVKSVRWGTDSRAEYGNRLHLTLDRDFPSTSLSSLTLQVGSHSFALSAAVRGNSDGSGGSNGLANNYRWSQPSGWSDPAVAATVTVKLLRAGTTTTPTKPAKPTGFTATAGNAKVDLSWTDPKDSSITKYQYRQKEGSAAYGNWTNIPTSAPGQTNATSYSVTGLKNGTAYRFRIRAVNAAGNGVQSDVQGPVTPKATATVPTVPTGPNVVWSATLNVKDASDYVGCDSGITEAACSDTSILIDDDFEYEVGGVSKTISIEYILSDATWVGFEFDTVSIANAKTDLADLTFTVGTGMTARSFAFADGTLGRGNLAQIGWFTTTSLGWSVGDTVALSLTAPASTNSAATGKPSISGTARVGQTLTAAKGTIADTDGLTKAEAGDASFAYIYQWIRVDSDGSSNAAEISGATSSTYTLQAADQGKRVKVKVGFKDDAGNFETLTSDAYPESGTVGAAAPLPKVALVLGTASIAESGTGNNTTVKATLPSAVTSDVTVTLGSAPTGKVNFGAATVTIPANGTESPTTTVTAVDNKVDAADATVTVSGTIASTLVTAPDSVTLTVTDDDTKGVTLSRTTVPVNEGGTAEYTVKLDSEPTASVVVTPTSGDTGAVTVSTAAANDKLTFTTSNWQTEQTVTVTGVQDADSDDETVTVTHAVSGSGSGYGSVSVSDVSVSVDDDDEADSTRPTVTANQTGYYTTAAAATALTGPVKSGVDIYTKVTFSEDMKHTKSDGNSARPELFYRIGSTDRRYDILDSGDTLASGDCKPNHSTNTNVYICRFTVGSQNGAFAVKAGTNSVDKANNALSSAYTHAQTITLDNTAPSVTANQSGYYSDAALMNTLTGPVKGGVDIYVKVTFSENMRHVKSNGTSARPQIGFSIGGDGTDYDMLDYGDTLASEDCKPNHSTNTNVFICRYTVGGSDNGAFKFDVDAVEESTDLAGNDLPDYTHSSEVTLDNTAPAAPSALVLASGTTSPGSDATPSIEVTVAETGGKVTLYSNSTCTTAASAATDVTDTTSPIKVTIDASTIASDETVTFYAKHADAADNASACSSANVAYTYDGTAPTVTAASTGYFTTAAAATALTGPLKAGANIYTKVTFSEDMKHVKSDAAAARPALSYSIGGTDTRYHILNVGETLATGDCMPNHASETDEYICRYTVASGDNGAFLVKAGTNSVDESGRALAAVYTHAQTIALDTAAPAAPVSLNAEAGDTKVTLTWSDPSTADATIDKWQYRQKTTGNYGAWQDISGGAAARRVEVTGLMNGTAYTFQVRAVDTAANEGAAGTTDAVTPAAPTLPKLTLVLGGTSIAESGAGNNTTVKATVPSAVSAAVTVTLGSTPPGKVSFGAATVTIPSGGTESPTTTVTAVDNKVDAADATVSLSGSTTSTLVTAPDSVSLTVTDDDTKGVTVSATTVSVNEGGNGTYTVKLDSEPTASVVVTPASGDAGAVTVSTAASDNTLTFTTSNWQTAQTVTVAGVEDADSTDESVTVTHAVSGAGSGYESVTAASVTVAVDDDETADATRPTVTSNQTGYFTSAAATTALTGPQKSGAAIYTKVTFSEDMKHVKSNTASARPELFRRIGTADTQYHILDNGDALASGDCKPNHATNTNVYICLYTVASGDSGAFAVKAGTNSVDKADNALASAYIHSQSVTLDNTAPTAPSALVLASGTTSPGSDATPSIEVTVAETGGQVTLYSNATCTTAASAATDVTDTTSPIKVTVDATTLTADGAVTYYAKHADAADNASACSSANVAYTYDGTAPTVSSGSTGYYSDAGATNAITAPQKAGASVYTKVTFSEDMKHVKSNAAAARPALSYSIGGSDTRYHILDNADALASGDCKPNHASETDEYICLYTVASGNNGAFAVKAGTDSVDKAGNALATAYTHAQTIALDTAAPAAPVSLNAAPGDTKVTLTWGNPSPADATIAKWQHRHKTTGEYGSWTDVAGGASKRTVEVTGLMNGTAYTFQLRAVDTAANDGAASTAGPVTPTAPSTSTGTPGGIWSATLTVDYASNRDSNGVYGCDDVSDSGSNPVDRCSVSTVLTDDDFDWPTTSGTTYRIDRVYTRGIYLYLGFSGVTAANAKTALTGLTLNVGSGMAAKTFAIADATAVTPSARGSALRWSSPPSWSSGDTVALSLTAAASTANSAATGKPTVTGTARVGQTLTAAKGTIADTNGVTKADKGDAGFAWTYQWIRVDSDGSSNPVNISGATSGTYVLATADQGKRVKVKVSFKDDAGNAESRTSDAYPRSGTVDAASTGTLPSGPNKLIGNVAQTASAYPVTFKFDAAQLFDTGRHPGGYRLTHVDIGITDGSSTTPAYTVKIHAPKSPDRNSRRGGVPGAVLATLTNPGSLPKGGGGFARFTAPGNGIDLEPRSRYFVVIDAGSAERRVKVSTVKSSSGAKYLYSAASAVLPPLDRDSVAEWSFGGLSWKRSAGSTGGWTKKPPSPVLQMAVYGTAKAAPPPEMVPEGAIWSASLTVDRISNFMGWLGCGNWHSKFDKCNVVLSDDDFVHGGATYGIDTLDWNAKQGREVLSLVLRGPSGDAARAALGSLTLHVDGRAFAFGDASIDFTDGLVRYKWPWNARWREGQFVSLALTDAGPSMAPEASAPALEWARVNGAELGLRFDQGLDESSLPAAAAFSVSVAGAARAVSSVSVGQDLVTLTLTEPVSAGETVTVGYTPPSSGKLRLSGGGTAVAAFSGLEVANDTPAAVVEGALTASVSQAPSEHRGKGRFEVRIAFSEAVTARAKDAAIQVTGGTLAGAVRVDKRKDLWALTLAPSGYGAVTLTLAEASDCSAAGAVCTADGRGLAGALTHTVPGPVALSVADARAKEGEDETLDFQVALSRAASAEVTVGYATRDGTAKKGKDYRQAKGTLTFAAGETAKTVSVELIDDAKDEGEETFTLLLTKATGAVIADGEATGTIENDDPMPQAWLARFGRTVAIQAVDAVTERLEAGGGGSHVTLGGQQVSLDSPQGRAEAAADIEAVAAALGAGPADRWPRDPWTRGGEADEGAGPSSQTMTGRELLLGSAFHLHSGGETGGPAFAAWGRVATGGFDGEEDGVTMDGTVTTGFLGADVSSGRWLAGMAVALSDGEGSFALSGAAAGESAFDRGEIESSLTSVLPYARLELNERVSAWAMAGYGTGEFVLTEKRAADGENPAVTERHEADLTMTLGALGGRGMLVDAPEGGGFALALKGDAFWVRTESDATEGMEGAKADATRLRLILDASRPFALADGGTLTPSLEVGLRQDGGDAETGTGVELGAGLAWADPASGVSVELRGRWLAAHESSGYEEWGASGAVRIDPGDRGRGLSLTLAPTIGAAGSGTGNLWSAADARGIAPDGAGFEAEQRLDAELGYGLAMFGDRFTGTPHGGLTLSQAAREYRLGWRLTSAMRGDPGFEIGLDATRREAANDNAPPEHGIGLRLTARW